MNDKKILGFFENGKREKAFKELYKLYPRIERLILSKGGTKQDASDVFQEALLILNRNIEKSNFKLTSTFYTYLFSVSRFIWKDEQRRNIQQKSIESIEDSSIENQVKEEKKYQLAEMAFSELGERCKQLLTLFYHQKLSFKMIADRMQFSSDRVAKNQKYKCLAKAKANFKAIQS